MQAAMANPELSPACPPFLHLLSAFLAMEPTDSLISFARLCGGGKITESIQKFIWFHCISKTGGECHLPYVKSFLKKIIYEVESDHNEILDELYEQYAYYTTAVKDDNYMKESSRVLKLISFLFPDNCYRLPSCPKSMNLMVPLQCSLNMLEGDTGCAIWPSSLFLSEFILSCPEIFCNKSCFEVGSGVGLIGISLAHVKASRVILTDGDLSTLANMKANLELNQLSIITDFPETNAQDRALVSATGGHFFVHEIPAAPPDAFYRGRLVKCMCLPWESASEIELKDFKPDIVLGADVIYDPLYLPHLVRVLAILLTQTRSSCYQRKDVFPGLSPETGSASRSETYSDEGINNLDQNNQNNILRDHDGTDEFDSGSEYPRQELKRGPVAYITSVIRNIDTFNQFLALAGQANLDVADVTERFQLLDLLPYMLSYDRSVIRLFAIRNICK